MGLDITAYRRLKPAPNAKLDADGNVIMEPAPHGSVVLDK